MQNQTLFIIGLVALWSALGVSLVLMHRRRKESNRASNPALLFGAGFAFMIAALLLNAIRP